MRRFYGILLAVLTAVLLTVPATADVLWEPEDAFYQAHTEDCTLLQRSFYTNGAAGYVNFYASPESSSVTGQMENGEKLYVYWQYEDWGYVEEEGWVVLSDLQLIYDYLSFEEEYGDQFLPYDVETCGPLLDEWTGDTLALWPYPGAAEVSYVWQDAGDAMADLKEYGFSSIFVDEEGLTWGFCGYLYGNRNFWVCLDAPAGRDDPVVTGGAVEIPVRQVEQPELTPAQEPELPAAYYIPYTLGVLIAVGAVWLLARRFLPKQRKRL